MIYRTEESGDGRKVSLKYKNKSESKNNSGTRHFEELNSEGNTEGWGRGRGSSRPLGGLLILLEFHESSAMTPARNIFFN